MTCRTWVRLETYGFTGHRQAESTVGQLAVCSNDPSNPQKVVALRAISARPAPIQAIPDHLPLQAHPGQDSPAREILVRNGGAGKVSIQRIWINEGRFPTRRRFRIVRMPALPHTLAPGETFTLSVSFNSPTAGEYSATLYIADGSLQNPQVALKGIAE